MSNGLKKINKKNINQYDNLKQEIKNKSIIDEITQ